MPRSLRCYKTNAVQDGELGMGHNRELQQQAVSLGHAFCIQAGVEVKGNLKQMALFAPGPAHWLPALYSQPTAGVAGICGARSKRAYQCQFACALPACLCLPGAAGVGIGAPGGWAATAAVGLPGPASAVRGADGAPARASRSPERAQLTELHVAEQ